MGYKPDTMTGEIATDFIDTDARSGIYRYYRRVPSEVAHLDSRTHIKKSLKTRDREQAASRALLIHKTVEDYWAALSAGADASKKWEVHRNAVAVAQSIGFSYRTDVSELPIAELIARADTIARIGAHNEVVARALTGTIGTPKPLVSDIWRLYEDNGRSSLMGMSVRQMRKHKVSRERAIAYLTEVLGDVELGTITRSDVLRFKDWWIDKIKLEGLTAYSANRSFSDIKGMISVIDDALHTDFGVVWAKLRIKETNATKLKKRYPFTSEWIQTRILANGALDNLNEDARLIVYTMAETGMRLGEVCNLRPEDIRLDDEIPHVEVAERTDRRQKTEQSVRRVPLVGVALWAMKQRPNGFLPYQDKADSASAIINKQLKKNGLRPTPRHTAYSLRHSFQDRIENAGASDRMQADLMGHEFGRPTYGDGAEMKRRQGLLDSIKFTWDYP